MNNIKGFKVVAVPPSLVPLSVIGFDDDIIAGKHKPALTTVRIGSLVPGYQGAEMVIERREKPHEPVRKIIMPVELIVRGSTGVASASNG